MKNAALKLGTDFEVPAEYVTHSGGLLAVRGAGKTNAARVMAEAMYDAGYPFVAIDPVGSWWGLRAGHDGTAAGGLGVLIVGGKHGDIKLHREMGVQIADFILKTDVSCVVDLSEFESENDKKKFLLDFAVRLYQKNESARHVFLEEADDYIPQRPQRDELRLKRAWENIVRRGRSRGLGFTLITQRSAVVNKDVLTQVETLFVLRTTGTQDRKAIEAWVTHNDTGITKKELEAVPALASGEAFCWSPTLLGKSVRMSFRLSRTFDSGATPKPGEKRRAATLAEVDLAPLHDALAEVADEDDTPPTTRSRAVVRDHGAALDELIAKNIACTNALQERDARIAELEQALDAIKGIASGEGVTVPTQMGPATALARNNSGGLNEAPVVQRDAKPAKLRGKQVDESPEYSGSLSKVARSLLTALAQHGDLSLEQAAIIAGYASNAGNTRNGAGELRAGGFAEGANASLRITAKGRHETRDDPRLPTGKKLAEYWYGKLERAPRLLLSEVVGAYPGKLSLKDAAKGAGLAPDAGNTRNAAGRLRTLSLVHGGNAGMTADRRLV